MNKTFLSPLICLALLCPSPTQAQSVELPSGMIPASATAAILAKPAEILRSPSMEMVPREVLTVMGLKDFGIDPCQIQGAMLLVDAFSDLRNPPGFALVITFGQPQQPGAKLTANFKQEKLDGHTIYRMNPQTPVILQYDPATIIFGMEPFIQKMLTAKNAESPLIDLVHREKDDAHFSAFVTMKPMRGTINDDFLSGVGPLPPPFDGLLALPNLIESLAARVDYTDTQRARLRITAVDEAAGKRIADLFDSCIHTGRQMLMATMATGLSDQDPVMRKAIAQYMNRVGDNVEANIRPQRMGKQVVFEVSGENGQLTNIAMMGTLTGLLLPAVQQAREAARRASSMNNLRQIGLAFHNFAEVHKRFPSDIRDKAGQPLLSWRVAILPYLEQNELYKQFHLDEPWDSDHNRQLLSKMPAVYAVNNASDQQKTVYMGFHGNDTVFGEKPGHWRNITDGTSNTILAVEANLDEAVNWTQPKGIPFNPNHPVTAVGRLRPGGFNALLLDGSVQFLPNSIAQEVLNNLIQKSDGNPVRLPDD